VDYDPNQISYSEILEIFWKEHNPTRQAWSRQYMAAVFYENEEQERIARQSKEKVARELQKEIQTEIISLDNFYLAEGYHQKYYLRSQAALLAEIKAYYPEVEGFTNSTVAARLNGIVGGHADAALVEKEIDSYGLSLETRELVEFIVY